MMKKLSILLVLFFFACAGNAQYNPEILGYNIYFAKIDTSEIMPIENTLVKKDTTLNITWEHSPDINPESYITNYQTIIHHVEWVPNTIELWAGTDTTSTHEEVSFPRGMYEMTVTAVDTLQYQTGHSNPWYIKVTAILATIPFHLKTK